jgi:membrane-bound lytic murein transglycosylase D
MKQIQSKSLLTLIIIFFIIGFSTSARDMIGLISINSDSAFEDSIYPKVHIQKTLVKNPGYVVYPSNLEEHRDESMDYVKYYSKQERKYIIHMFSKGKNYFPKAANIFDKYDVPDELQVLPALESNFNSNAVSSAGAVGYWQFMEELAGEYGLNTNGKNDERKNFSKSTIAAAKFFRSQLKFFNDDLLLTVAAFNCGQGGVSKALKKSSKSDPDFWDIKKFLPNETRLFVMRFIALNVISANYEKFLERKLNFSEPHLIHIAALDSIKPDNSISRN